MMDAPRRSLKIKKRKQWWSHLLVLATVIVFFIYLYQSSQNILVLNLSLPGIEWGMRLRAKGFVIQEDRVKADKMGGRIVAANEEVGMTLSIFFEKVNQRGTSLDCRRYYWNLAQESPVKKEEVKMREQGQMAIVEYLVKDIEGIPIHQKNFNAYMVRDNVWIDIHLSKIKFKPEDEALFNAILKSVKFREK